MKPHLLTLGLLAAGILLLILGVVTLATCKSGEERARKSFSVPYSKPRGRVLEPRG